MPKLDHVALRVKDLNAAITFYTEKLGLKLLFRKIDPAHDEAFAFLEMTGGKLELLQLLDPSSRESEEITPDLSWTPPELEKPYCPHLAFETTDLDFQQQQLRAHDIPILAGPLEIPDSVRWLYFHDPDHNVLEYIQYLSS